MNLMIQITATMTSIAFAASALVNPVYADISTIPVERVEVSFNKIKCEEGKTTFRQQTIKAHAAGEEKPLKFSEKDGNLTIIGNELHLKALNGETMKIGHMPELPADCNYSMNEFNSALELEPSISLALDGTQIESACYISEKMFRFRGDKKKNVKADLLVVDRETQIATNLGKMQTGYYISKKKCANLVTVVTPVAQVIALPFLLTIYVFSSLFGHGGDVQ